MEEVNVYKRKICKSKIQEDVIKKSYDILMPPSESVSLSSLENKGQDGNLENCILKGQIIESSNLEVNKNSKEDEENHKTARIYGTSQNVKSLNGGKENSKLLTDKRSQILSSNCREENTCEVLEKKKMNSKLMTGLGETKTKIHKKLRNPVPL